MKPICNYRLKPLVFVVTILLISLLSACTSGPRSIAVQDSDILLNYELLNQNTGNAVYTDETLLDKKARWAGKIVSVQNNQKFSKITISYYPSAPNGRPKTELLSTGQFVAIVPGYVEPRVFSKGRMVTVLGNTVYPLGYPTLYTAGLYMWKDIGQVKTDPHNMLSIALDERSNLNDPSLLSPFSADQIGYYDDLQPAYEFSENNGNSQSIVVKETN